MSEEEQLANDPGYNPKGRMSTVEQSLNTKIAVRILTLVSISNMVKTIKIHNTELTLYLCGIIERLEISEFYLKSSSDS